MQIEKKRHTSSIEDLLREFLLPKETKLSWNQVYEWLWSKGAHSFEDMTNISKETRTMLESNFVINHIKVDTIQRSDDGTIKNAVRLHDGLVVESVLIPTNTRTTACVSSQGLQFRL
jgi:23S rRNA (adenine2503-C2)-methyltransferase